MGALYFSADLHFTHKMVAEHRGYSDPDEHDADVIRWWNSRVRPEDQVWLLGDVSLKNPALFWPLVDQLHGEKHLVAGNHDKVWPGHRDAHRVQREWLEHFASIQPFARRKIAGEQVLLSHFPYLYGGDHTETERYTQYRLVNEGLWLLCGHVHWKWKQRGMMINVGLDAWGMAPVRLDEIEALMAAGPADVSCPLTPRQAADELSRLGEELQGEGHE